MSDAELATFLGLDGMDGFSVARVIRTITPAKRAVYEKMRDVELWDKGLGPLPDGVMVDRDRKRRRPVNTP